MKKIYSLLPLANMLLLLALIFGPLKKGVDYINKLGTAAKLMSQTLYQHKRAMGLLWGYIDNLGKKTLELQKLVDKSAPKAEVDRVKTEINNIKREIQKLKARLRRF